MAAGRVMVNDKPAVLGMKVGPADHVTIDGKPCNAPPSRLVQSRVIGIHKPPDVVCTRHDPEGRASIFELLPAAAKRWVMVGRLDLTTSGLVLFTDDGELAHRLTHPSYEIARRYAVRVLGTPTEEDVAAMLAGVEVEGEVLKFDRVAEVGGDGANRWFDCTLHTGRNREVRRLWEAHGIAVSRLMRVSYGPLALPREVRPGKWFEVEGDPLIRLYQAVGLASPIAETPSRVHGSRLRTKAGDRPAPRSRAGTQATGPKKMAADRTAKIDYLAPGERPRSGPPRGRGDAPGYAGAGERPRSGPPRERGDAPSYAGAGDRPRSGPPRGRGDAPGYAGAGDRPRSGPPRGRGDAPSYAGAGDRPRSPYAGAGDRPRSGPPRGRGDAPGGRPPGPGSQRGGPGPYGAAPGRSSGGPRGSNGAGPRGPRTPSSGGPPRRPRSPN